MNAAWVMRQVNSTINCLYLLCYVRATDSVSTSSFEISCPFALAIQNITTKGTLSDRYRHVVLGAKSLHQATLPIQMGCLQQSSQPAEDHRPQPKMLTAEHAQKKTVSAFGTGKKTTCTQLKVRKAHAFWCGAYETHSHRETGEDYNTRMFQV